MNYKYAWGVVLVLFGSSWALFGSAIITWIYKSDVFWQRNRGMTYNQSALLLLLVSIQPIVGILIAAIGVLLIRFNDKQKVKYQKYKIWIYPTVVAILCLFWWPHYRITHRFGTMRVFTHGKELFIAINRGTQGWHGNNFQLLYLTITNNLGGSNSMRNDLILWHLKDNHLHRYFYNHKIGPIFVYKDDLYFATPADHTNELLLGQVNTNQYWRWTGNGLSKLPMGANDILKRKVKRGEPINNSFPKGWKEVSMSQLYPDNQQVKETVLLLDQRKYRIIVSQKNDFTNRPFWRQYILSGVGGNKSEVLLYSYTDKAQTISKEVYQKYFGTD